MSEHNTHTAEAHEHGDHGAMTKGKIWKVFFILLALTIIEFIIALWAIPGHHMTQSVGNYVYIVLTLFKAFYIVAYFMHLKFEKLGLQLVLGISFIFIIYFIALLLIEGGYLHLHMPKV
ncbi:cytochrome C oxidase subunit IV family protein [Pedobacter montanisoli]|uniref:Cytochrome C oxidase subunit IV family protein n=1 Tax=Pedobacter montanisoli TaxID=2923277 RepID=A0ABS9ZUM2_9SPHI|nr:cytochrome C oxidase subunit IV family protein [Pedobacter montanisoli]MCJ0741248.1 cytochrome C oxidase subunit IV family protein [Pedobacter montanisoli]